MALLILDRLRKLYGEHAAVDDLSLDVETGEFVALLGPSGCGKTTTLQMIAGFVDPTSGAITLDGADLLKVKPNKRGLGIVFQSYALFPHMTVAENVGFGLEMQGINKVERGTRVAEVLSLVGLGAFAERYPRRLSGGQQQRVALARALVIRPRILLLDEPLSNLDAKLREEMQIELRQIQRTVGTTTILVTHDQAEAMALSDRVVIMNQGRVEQIAPPYEAYESPASPFVAGFLGKTNLLRGQVHAMNCGARLMVGEALMPAPLDARPGEAAILVRPEKISFDAEKGLPGTVRNRVFQGSQWLFQVETEGGPVTVLRQNDSGRLPDTGDKVFLTWRAEDVRPGGGT